MFYVFYAMDEGYFTYEYDMPSLISSGSFEYILKKYK
jgi:hypothetical protein